MKIAVNCWILRNKKIDGIGNFTIETLRLLISAHPEIKFQILCDKNFTEDYFDFPNAKKYHIFPPYRHPLLYFFFMEVVVGFFLKKHKPDLFLSMEGFLCLSTNCKQLPIIYDLNFEHQPEDLPFRNRIYFRTFYPKFARKATRIVTISEYSKNDIAETYKIPLNKIDNVSCGVKESFSLIDDKIKQITRDRYTKGAEYFFFIGSMHPRKNIVRLLQAFELFKKKSNAPLKLVLAGNIFWGDESVQAVISTMNAKDDIVFTGRISDDELVNLLGSAFALTFVPTFEGFGLPIVEAFQSDVPVICSSTTSMPEVAGNAALMVDPLNIEDIADKMKLLWNDKLLVQELIDKGRLQKNLFTWKRTSELLYKSIQNCVKL